VFYRGGAAAEGFKLADQLRKQAGGFQHLFRRLFRIRDGVGDAPRYLL
jgi:hypothetical protein